MDRKIWLACGGGLLASVALATWAWTASTAGRGARGPVAVLSLPQSRIEGVPGSGPARVSFQITNRGDAELVLGEPSSTCGCTAASLSPRVLAPGASAAGLIDAHPPSVGQRTVEVDIPTNAPAEDGGGVRFRLTLVGTAKPPYVVNTSGAVQLGETTASRAAAEARLETREAAGTPPWITSVRSSIPELGIEGGIQDGRPLEGGILDRVYVFKIAPISPLKIGDIAGEIQFVAGGSDEGVVHTLPILGRILPRVHARPSRLYARLKPGSPPPRLHFSVQAADPDAVLEAEPLEWPRDAVDVQLTGRSRSRLDFVAVPRPGHGGDLDSELLMSTNDPDVPRVTIPLTLLRATARP